MLDINEILSALSDARLKSIEDQTAKNSGISYRRTISPIIFNSKDYQYERVDLRVQTLWALVEVISILKGFTPEDKDLLTDALSQAVKNRNYDNAIESVGTAIGNVVGYSNAKKLVDRAEGIMMTRKREETSIESWEPIPADKPEETPEKTRTLVSLVKQEGIAYSSLNKEANAKIRNKRAYIYGNAKMGVQKISVHSFVTAGGEHKNNMNSLIDESQQYFNTFKDFMGIGDSDPSYVYATLVDGPEAAISKLTNSVKDENENTLFNNAQEADKKIDKAKIYRVNTTQKAGFVFNYKPNPELTALFAKKLEVLMEAYDKNMQKGSKDLAARFNTMNAKLINPNVETNQEIDVLKSFGVEAATEHDVVDILKAKKTQLQALVSVYNKLSDLSDNYHYKPALECMIASRMGIPGSLGCKSGKDRAFVHICVANVIESKLTQISGMNLGKLDFSPERLAQNLKEFLGSKEYAKDLANELMRENHHGRKVGAENCDGAYGTKDADVVIPKNINKEAMLDSTYEKLTDYIKESNKYAQQNKYSFKAKKPTMWQRIINWFLRRTEPPQVEYQVISLLSAGSNDFSSAKQDTGQSGKGKIQQNVANNLSREGQEQETIKINNPENVGNKQIR